MADIIKDSSGQAVIKSKGGGLMLTNPEHARKLVDQGEYSAATPEDIAAHNDTERGGALGAAGRGAAVGAVDAALAAPKLATALAFGGLRAAGARVHDPLADVSGRGALTGAAGLAASVTGGDAATAKQETAETLRADTEFHPIATTAGEIIGGLPLLATGGAALEAAAAKGAARLGLGAGAARLAGQVGGNAVIGAGMGATAASEQAWIKDSPLTAEQSLASIGLGALFGGGGALGLSAAGKAVPSLARALGRGAPEVEEGLSAAATRTEAGEAAAVTAAKVKPKVADFEAVPESLGKRLRRWVNNGADEDAVDAISRGNKPALKALGHGEAPTLAAKRETGALLHEMKILAPGRGESEMWELAQQAKQQNGKVMGAVMDTLDKEHGYADARPLLDKIEDLAQTLEKDSKLSWIGEGEKAATFVREKTQKLAALSENGIVKHSDLHEYRQALDTLSKWQRANPGAAADAARDMRRLVSDEIKEQIQKASPELRREWDVANKRYGAAAWAEDTLGERVSVRSGANRWFSPTDYGTTLATAVGTANPLVGLAAGLGNKLLRERGYSTYAAIAKRLAGEAVDVGAAPAAGLNTARRLQTLVANTHEQVEGHFGSFLGTPRDAVARTTRQSATVAALRSADIATSQAAYRDHAREVQLIASNPDLARERLNGITGAELAAVAPGLQADMAQVAVRGAQYLASNLPAPPTDPDSITPHLDEPPPVSQADAYRYADRVEGVENPLSFLADLLEGKVSPEKRDAVKAVWPQVFEGMRQTMFTQLAEAKEPVPHDKRKALDIALDMNGALEPSFKPSSLAVMAAVAKATASARPMPRPRGPTPQLSKMFETRSSRVAMR